MAGNDLFARRVGPNGEDAWFPPDGRVIATSTYTLSSEINRDYLAVALGTTAAVVWDLQSSTNEEYVGPLFWQKPRTGTPKRRNSTNFWLLRKSG